MIVCIYSLMLKVSFIVKNSVGLFIGELIYDLLALFFRTWTGIYMKNVHRLLLFIIFAVYTAFSVKCHLNTHIKTSCKIFVWFSSFFLFTF